MPTYLGIALVGTAVLGVAFKSVEFVRVTMPHNYGRNPGFGAYESMVLPWWIAGCVGVGLLSSWYSALIVAVVGLVGLGPVAQLLGRWFGQ